MDFKWHWNINDFYNQNGYDTNTSFNKFSDILFGTNFSQNADNKKIAEQNIAWQQEANAQNIAFQKEENAITRAREDNAVQRAASDMTAAGLSKTLAAGQPASAASLTAPRTQAVNNSMKFENAYAKLDMFQRLQDLAFRKKEYEMAAEKNAAEVANINAQAHGQELANGVFLQNNTNQQLLTIGQTAYYKSMENLNNATIDLRKIESSYKSQEIETDIAYKVAQTKLTNENFEKVKQEILAEVAQTYKLQKEALKVCEEIVTERLKQKSMGIDQNYALTNGLPVGVIPGGLVGSIVPAAQSIASMGYNNIVSPIANTIKNTVSGIWNGTRKLFGFGE